MISFLKNHPFAVETHFESSIVLTFAIPKKELQDFIPECLELDTFQDKWAFIAIAMVQTSGLRPKGFPKFMGNDFFLIGYRIFVRYPAAARIPSRCSLHSQINVEEYDKLKNPTNKTQFVPRRHLTAKDKSYLKNS